MHQPEEIQEQAREAGYPESAPVAPGDQSLPPGGGKIPVPHYLSFAQLWNSVARTYRWTHDEALRHSRENSLAIRRDPVVMDALRSRQIPTAQLPWHLEAEDDQDMAQAEAVTTITEIIESIPNFQRLKMHLLEALWFGRYGVQLVWGWDFTHGQKRLVVRDHRPINGDKLVFKYSGEAGILVHGTYQGEWEATDRGRAHFFDSEERKCVIIHRHEPEDADYLEGEMAGGVHGVGIRSRIYWFWWLRSQISAFLFDYLERVGAGGFTVYFYEHGSDASLEEVKTAAETQHRQNTILFPRYKDGSPGGPGIMRIPADNAGSQLLQSLIAGYFDEVIRRYILGQNLTSEAVGTGLGSGVADLHADTFARLVKYDAVALAETLTTDLVWVIQQAMPEYAGLPRIKFVFDVDKPNARDVLESAERFFQMGGAVDEDELRGIIGLARPQPGHSILSKIGSMQPAGLPGMGMPTGVPMMGPPGPAGAPQGGLPPMGPMPMRRKGKARPLSRKLRELPQRPARYSRLETDPRLLEIVQDYLAQRRLPQYRGGEYRPLNPPLSRSIAEWYDDAAHEPMDPAVQAAYDAMTGETRDQFDWAERAGIRMRPWTRPGQPYKDSREMREDALGGNLHYFLGGDMPQDHPLAGYSGVTRDGHRHSKNDLFRAVHDLFGHALHGNEFGPRGEEHAWRTHSRMYSPMARPAMGAETRGQNSWVNWGKHLRRPDGSLPQRGEPDWVHPAERPFAQQKATVLPDAFGQDL